MSTDLHRDALSVVQAAIQAVCPDQAVAGALCDFHPTGRLILVSVGKAGWQMAKAALDVLPTPINAGIVVTKYGHVCHDLPGIACYEAGHPMPDENSFRAAQAVLDLTAELEAQDTVLFLLSGGGSALFEKPLVSPEELQDITTQLLSSGADITGVNTIRKRLSAVKAGRFALHCAPARVYAVVLSDILGDRLDMVASGPAAADPSTLKETLNIVKKYGLRLSDHALHCLEQETPKTLNNVQVKVIGSVRELCQMAQQKCEELGYETILLTDHMDGEAREMGRMMGHMLASHSTSVKKMAFVAGGETVVHLRGGGLGGRNQELALAAAEPIAGVPGVCLISVGSDGTDGPTDAAGGYVDGRTVCAIKSRGLDYWEMLDNNDAYHALEVSGGLVMTGPTGTNVNDVTIGFVDM